MEIDDGFEAITPDQPIVLDEEDKKKKKKKPPAPPPQTRRQQLKINDGVVFPIFKRPVHVSLPSRVSEIYVPSGPYIEDIYKILLSREEAFMVNRATITGFQDEFDFERRKRMVHIFIIHQKGSSLTSQSIFRAINYVDRYSEKKKILRDQVGIIGITSLFIAGKYEQMDYFTVNDFVVFASFVKEPKKAILQTETLLLTALEFKLQCPTVLTFLEHYRVVCGLHHLVGVVILADYFVHIFLGEPGFLDFKPSKIAAAAFLLGMKTAKLNSKDRKAVIPTWDEKIRNYTKYNEEDLQDCMDCIRKAVGQIQENLMKYEKLYMKFYPVSSYRLS